MPKITQIQFWKKDDETVGGPPTGELFYGEPAVDGVGNLYIGVPDGGVSTTTTLIAGPNYGAMYVVASIAARDAIIASQRREGMFASVVDDGLGVSRLYRLEGGILNANWVEFTGGGGGAGSLQEAYDGGNSMAVDAVQGGVAVSALVDITLAPTNFTFGVSTVGPLGAATDTATFAVDGGTVTNVLHAYNVNVGTASRIAYLRNASANLSLAVTEIENSTATVTVPLLKLTQNVLATSGPHINFVGKTADPAALVEGDLWYNATDNLLRYYDGTSTIDVGGAGASTLQGIYNGSGANGGLVNISGVIGGLAGFVDSDITLGGAVAKLATGGVVSTGGKAEYAGVFQTLTGGQSTLATLYVSAADGATAGTSGVAFFQNGSTGQGGVIYATNDATGTLTLSHTSVITGINDGTAGRVGYFLNTTATLTDAVVEVANSSATETAPLLKLSAQAAGTSGPHINLVGKTADPGTLAAGDIWYNTTDTVLRYYNGTTTIDITAGNTPTVYEQTILTTNTSTVDSLVIATYRSVEWFVQVSDGTAGTYATSKIIATHDGAATYWTETSMVGSFISYTPDVDISAGSMRLRFTDDGANTIVVKAIRIGTLEV